MSASPKRNGVGDSGEIPTGAALGFIPDHTQQFSLSKILGIVTGILTVLAAVIATPLFVVNRVEASAATTRTEMKESLEAHADSVHDKDVTKAVYVEHVKLADERYARIEKKLDQLLERQ